MKPRIHNLRGLTLIEVLFVLAVIAMLGAVLLPHSRSHQRSARLGCTSNLRQVALAARLYANDSNDGFPWRVSTNISLFAITGSLEHTNSPDVFRHYAAMSNELISPKVLACMNDTNRSKAQDFSSLSNSNVSYFVGLDADESKPERLLAGDRNITGGGLSNGFLRLLKPNDPAGWTKEIHVKAGNIGLSDGSVLQTDPRILRNHLAKQTLPVIRLAIP